jgi:hypothetical protein
VYDALNVLMAMDVIAKDRKRITWRGLQLPGGGSRLARLRSERDRLRIAVDAGAAAVGALATRAGALRALVLRNADAPAHRLAAAAAAGPSSPGAPPPPTPLALPFILVAARADAAVEVQIADDGRAAAFDFHESPFRVVGGEDVLAALGLDGGAGGSGGGSGSAGGGTTPSRTSRRGGGSGDPMLTSPSPFARARRRTGTTGATSPARGGSPTCGGASRPGGGGRSGLAPPQWPVAS